jgi:hypothetical protein
MFKNKCIGYLVAGVVFLSAAFLALWALLDGMTRAGAGALIR